MNTAKSQSTTSVSSLQDAKLRVHQMQEEGKNPRDILKTKFDFDGKVFGFNVTQLSEIKKKFELKANTTVEYSISDLFRLFKEGMSPVQVIIKTNTPVDEVKTVYDDFLKLEGMTATQYFVDKIYSLARKVMPIDGTINDVLNKIETAVESHIEFEQYKYPCSDCGKLIRISNGEWPEIYQFMVTENFGHYDCNNH